MMKKLSIYILLLCLSCTAYAQDLNARVQVLAPKVQTTNKRIFTELETAMKDFLNGRKWCADQILPAERFDCSFVLNLTAWERFPSEIEVTVASDASHALVHGP